MSFRLCNGVSSQNKEVAIESCDVTSINEDDTLTEHEKESQ